MTTKTSNMQLSKAEGSDDAKAYLETDLAASLDIIDSHRHTGGADGFQLQATAIPDGAVTTAKLADGVLSADTAGRAKMADGFVTSDKLAPGALFPAGIIVAYPSTATPSGFLPCDGAAVSRDTYAGLFAVIGTTFGSGNGSTTFNVPDLSGRVVVGYKSGDADFGTLGGKVGSKTVTLSEAEMPAHTHTIASSGAHQHTLTVYESYGNNSVVAAGDTASGSGNFSVSGGEHTHTPATTGSGSAHSNIQPSFVLAYYITT